MKLGGRQNLQKAKEESREPFSIYYREENRSKRLKSLYLKIKDSSFSSFSDNIGAFLIRLQKTLGSRELLSCNKEAMRKDDKVGTS